MDRAAAGHAADELTVVAKWNPTVHAPGTLLLEISFGQVVVKFTPIRDALDRRAVGGQLTFEI
jgi:hypothetical protein